MGWQRNDNWRERTQCVQLNSPITPSGLQGQLFPTRDWGSNRSPRSPKSERSLDQNLAGKTSYSQSGALSSLTYFSFAAHNSCWAQVCRLTVTRVLFSLSGRSCRTSTSVHIRAAQPSTSRLMFERSDLTHSSHTHPVSLESTCFLLLFFFASHFETSESKGGQTL